MPYTTPIVITASLGQGGQSPGRVCRTVRPTSPLRLARTEANVPITGEGEGGGRRFRKEGGGRGERRGRERGKGEGWGRERGSWLAPMSLPLPHLTAWT